MALRAPLKPNTGKPYVAEYDRRGVEALLTGLWNDGVVVDETAPDEGMPRAKANPSHLGGIVVGLIDIRRAVGRVADEQGQAILRLHYGDGKTQRQIAAATGISQATVSRRLDALVSELLAWLNGEEGA